MSSTTGSTGTTGSTSGGNLVNAMGHPQEKTATGNFIGKITGANQVEKVIDTAWNYMTGQQQQGSGNGAATAGGSGGNSGGAAQNGGGATSTQKQ